MKATGKALTAVALAASVTAPARAAPAPAGFDARTFRPPTDAMALVGSEPSAVPSRWEPSVGLWTGYAFAPLTVPGTGARVIENGASVDVVASLGLGFRSAVGVAIPTTFRLSGAAVGPPATAPGGVPTAALGDVAFTWKTCVQDASNGGLGVAVVGDVTAPTGHRDAFAADGAATATARLLAEYSMLALGARATAGFHGRWAGHDWPDASGARIGNELPWSVALWMRPAAFGGALRAVDGADRQVWEVALRGALPAGPVAPFGAGAGLVSPVLVSLADRIGLGAKHDVSVTAGIDFGVGSAVGVPVVRAMVALGWAPRRHDADGDGIPDDEDACPDIPGVRSPSREDNGCPRVDDDPGGAPRP